MSHDNNVTENTWVFGYGSLIWKPDFKFVERRVGYISGYRRRFYQGSTDHRGAPGAPGRVVTLIPSSISDPFLSELPLLSPPTTTSTDVSGAASPCTGGYFFSEHPLVDESVCWGAAYKIDPEDRPAIMSYLHHRERGGYSCVELPVVLTNGETINAVCWMATESNPEYIGFRPTSDMALQISAARGESGPNKDYLFRLRDALVEMGCLDAHVAALCYYVSHFVSNTTTVSASLSAPSLPHAASNSLAVKQMAG